MIDFTKPKTIYYLPGATPVPLSMEGHAQLIQSSQSFNPHESAAYLFCNSSRNRIRILYWDTHGFLSIIFQLPKGRLKWPYQDGIFTEISSPQLERLLQGDTITPSVSSILSSITL